MWTMIDAWMLLDGTLTLHGLMIEQWFMEIQWERTVRIICVEEYTTADNKTYARSGI